MSNIESFKHSPNSNQGVMERSKLNAEGVIELYTMLEKIRDRLRGGNVVDLEPAPPERVGDGLPSTEEMTSRYLGRCHQVAADIQKIL